MSKILINSQGAFTPTGAGINTGFAKVAYGVCNALAPTNEVGYVCHEHQGLSFEFNNKLLNTKYWIHRGNKNFQDSASEMKLHVDMRKPDYVLYIGEAWGAYPYKDINFENTELIMHIPVDGEPFDSTLATVGQMADLLVPASHYGKKVLNINNMPATDVIPHSFDPKVYYPFKQAQRDKAREKFAFKDEEFVVGFVGRQQERKNLMALIIAFAKFADGKNNVKLLLDITIDKYSDFNLVHMVKFLGIADKVLIIKSNNLSEADMADMYNALDMYISTSCSEGFNIPVLEAQACGVPCAVSEYAAHSELVRDHGRLIEVEDYRPMQNNIYWAYVKMDDAIASMNEYYDNINQRRKDANKATKFVNKYYTTDIVSGLWNNLFDNYEDVKEAALAPLSIRGMDINVEDE